jgi:exopolysaccharide biosynthesis protein
VETRTNPPTRMFIAQVDLANPKVQLRVAAGGPDPDGPGKWQTTLMRPTGIAAREKFDLVVNGDFFAARDIQDAEGTKSRYRPDVWAAVSGPAVTDGKVWSAIETERPCLVAHRNAKVAIEMVGRPTGDDWEVVSGNTMLVAGGKVLIHDNKARHPRTAVGLDAHGTNLVILVVDGRKPGVAVGMTYDEVGAEMCRLGCDRALNLDGGGSSVMAIRDRRTGKERILNTPSDGHERPVANVLGVRGVEVETLKR